MLLTLALKSCRLFLHDGHNFSLWCLILHWWKREIAFLNLYYFLISFRISKDVPSREYHSQFFLFDVKGRGHFLFHYFPCALVQNKVKLTRSRTWRMPLFFSYLGNGQLIIYRLWLWNFIGIYTKGKKINGKFKSINPPPKIENVIISF